VLSSTIECVLQNFVAVLLVGDVHDLRSKKIIEQQISRRVLRLDASQHENAFKPKPSRCRCGLPAMIGLDRAASDQGVRALGVRFGYKEFQFARLVTAKSEAGLVVAFDYQTRSAQFVRQTRERFNRRR
jgi:hypothetical protein